MRVLASEPHHATPARTVARVNHVAHFNSYYPRRTKMSFSRRALLDNATLTGVERLLGRIAVKNTYNIDGDLLCLENLLQAILFYDELFFLDDYKDEFKLSRAAFFNLLKPLPLKPETYEHYQEKAGKKLEELEPVIQNGTVKTSPLQELLDLINLNLIFTWDMRQSEYYLTLKLLDDQSDMTEDKYGALAAMIHSGVAEQKRVSTKALVQEPKILNQYGEIISHGIGEELELKDGGFTTSNGIDSGVKKFLAGLSWLCYRTIIYTSIATDFDCDLILHPIRHSCLATILPALRVSDSSRYAAIVRAMTDGADQITYEIGSTSSPTVFKHPLPIFSAWFATKQLKPSGFLSAARELRDENVFKAARNQFAELNAKKIIHGEARYKTETNLLLRGLNNTFGQLRSKYATHTPQGVPISPFIWALNAVSTPHGAPALPAPKGSIPIPQKLTEFISDAVPRKGFAAVFKSVVDDLAQVARLGTLYEKLTAEVNWMPDARKANARILDPRYRYSKGPYSIPME